MGRTEAAVALNLTMTAVNDDGEKKGVGSSGISKYEDIGVIV